MTNLRAYYFLGIASTGLLAVIASCVERVEGCEWNATCPETGGVTGGGNGGESGAEGGAGHTGGTAGEAGWSSSGGTDSSAGAGGADGTADGGTGGHGGDAGAGGGPLEPCSETGSGMDDLCIDETHGIFVSAEYGSNTTADGSRAKPYATITAAASWPRSSKPRSEPGA